LLGPGPGVESLAVPLVPGATFFLSMLGVGPAGDTDVVRRAAAPGTTVDLAFPPEPTLSTPPDLARSVDGTTTFAWTAPGSGIFDFFVQPVTFEGVADSGCCEQGYLGATADVYEVITASPTVTLAPFFASTPPPAHGPYYWGVRGYADRSSVDDAAGPHAIDWECDETSKAPDGDAACASVWRKFSAP
jgi:hypothetical protein